MPGLSPPWLPWLRPAGALEVRLQPSPASLLTLQVGREVLHADAGPRAAWEPWWPRGTWGPNNASEFRP